MALSPTLPTARFPAEPRTDERPSPAFAAARATPERDQALHREAARSNRARAGAPRPRERRLILTLVAATHLGAAIGVSQWRAEPVAPPPPPISVALIEPPAVIPTPVPPPPAPTPPTPEVRKELPRPKPVVKPAPPKPVKAPVPPAPVTEAATAIRNEEPPPPPAPAARPGCRLPTPQGAGSRPPPPSAGAE